MPIGIPKYELSELGYVAKAYIDKHIITFGELCEKIRHATETEINGSSFTQARRSERGFEQLRETVMGFMRADDPKLVEDALAFYDTHYRQKGA